VGRDTNPEIPIENKAKTECARSNRLLLPLRERTFGFADGA